MSLLHSNPRVRAYLVLSVSMPIVWRDTYCSTAFQSLIQSKYFSTLYVLCRKLDFLKNIPFRFLIFYLTILSIPLFLICLPYLSLVNIDLIHFTFIYLFYLQICSILACNCFIAAVKGFNKYTESLLLLLLLLLLPKFIFLRKGTISGFL